MPCQLLNRHPFTKTLSTLHKDKLIQLSIEFDLPTEGSVIYLRDRLKAHLTLHNDAIYNNPRYRGLYPKPHRLNLNKHHVTPVNASPIPSLPSPLDLPSPPAPVHPNQSLTPSFESWNGINPQPQDLQLPWSPHPQDIQPPWSPLHPLSCLGSLLPFFLPPPSNPPVVCNSPSPALCHIEEHEFFLCLSFALHGHVLPFSFLLLLSWMTHLSLFCFILVIVDVHLASYQMQFFPHHERQVSVCVMKDHLFLTCHERRLLILLS